MSATPVGPWPAVRRQYEVHTTAGIYLRFGSDARDTVDYVVAHLKRRMDADFGVPNIREVKVVTTGEVVDPQLWMPLASRKT